MAGSVRVVSARECGTALHGDGNPALGAILGEGDAGVECSVSWSGTAGPEDPGCPGKAPGRGG
jgi:hypothetical protein